MITKTIRKNAVDSFSFLTIASVCMGIFRAKFLTETWTVLIKEKCEENCKYDRNCVCEWIEGRKLDASSPLEILWECTWEPRSKFNVIKEKFEKSPIGLIPVHGYGSKDTDSKESIEWMSLLEHQWINKGKPISIQHARTPLGEKVTDMLNTKWMDTLNIKEGNMSVNIMDVISMDVRNVFLTVEKQQ